MLVQGKKQFCPGKENMPTAATQGPSVATPALPTAAMAPLPCGSRPDQLLL